MSFHFDMVQSGIEQLKFDEREYVSKETVVLHRWESITEQMAKG